MNKERKDVLARKGIMIVKRDQVQWQMGVESEIDFFCVPVAQRCGLQWTDC